MGAAADITPDISSAYFAGTILLCCPACGCEKRLQDAEGLPHGASRLIALCPACEGHGTDASLLMFDDGRVERVLGLADVALTQAKARSPTTQHALPLRSAAAHRRRMQTKESIARG